jgi:hypothetical protein
MRRDYFIILGILIIFVGCGLLFLAPAIKVGINDAEWGNITRTGYISRPTKVIWSDWQPGNGTVTRLRQYRPEEEFEPVTKVRTGRARGVIFDFTVYEGQCLRSNSIVTFPATGPNWGASFHREWIFAVVGAGAVFVAIPLILRRQTSALSK